jgi:phenylacetic acid degradation operon negative regulatory protein
MHARSALFDVYGDHLRSRGDRATVAGLVRLLATVGIRAPAVRTAVSRMVSQGWLAPVMVDGARGYEATPRAIARLEQAGNRIYRRSQQEWDGGWHLVLLEPFTERAVRSRAQRDLEFLGYAELADRVWVSPFEGPGLAEALSRAGARATTATSRDFCPADAPLRAWDLAGLGAAYDAWLREAAAGVEAHLDRHDDPDEAAFATRFHLVHEWRKFLFRDPGLPDELLPADWPGRAAAEYFGREASRLEPATRRFVARALAEG